MTFIPANRIKKKQELIQSCSCHLLQQQLAITELGVLQYKLHLQYFNTVIRAGVVAQWVNLPPEPLAPGGVLVPVPLLHSDPGLCSFPGKAAEGGPQSWATRVGGLDKAAGFCLQHGPARC